MICWHNAILGSGGSLIFLAVPTAISPHDIRIHVSKTGDVSEFEMGDGTIQESNSFNHVYSSGDVKTVSVGWDSWFSITAIELGSSALDDFDGTIKTWPRPLADFKNITAFSIVFSDVESGDFSFSGQELFPSGLSSYKQKRGTLKGSLTDASLTVIHLQEVAISGATLTIPSSVSHLTLSSIDSLTSIVFDGLSNIVEFELSVLNNYSGTIPSLGAACSILKLVSNGNSGSGITLPSFGATITTIEIRNSNVLNIPSLPSSLLNLILEEIPSGVSFPTLVPSITTLDIKGHFVTSANLSNCTSLQDFTMVDCDFGSTSSYSIPNTVEVIDWKEIDFTNWTGTAFTMPSTLQRIEVSDVVSNGPGGTVDFTNAVANLEYIRMQNAGLSQSEVDAYIDDVYTNRASFPLVLGSPNLLNFNNGGGGAELNSAPSGVYQAPSGYVQGDSGNAPNDGTPSSALEKLYVLANQTDQSEDKKYNWTVYYA